MRYNDLWRELAAIYGENEAKAVCRTVLDDLFGMSLTDIVCGGVESLSSADTQVLSCAMTRLKKGEPVQYVTGKAPFAGRIFGVAPGVLIPRPETEQLCDIVADLTAALPHPAILDIGTGSGCIACTLALDDESREVSAWDISDKALGIARDNAERLGARVNFVKQDALNAPQDTDRWDAIVSNPPYICGRERSGMHSNVLDHEPHLALFVPDDDPLLFYRAIAGYGCHALRPGGWLCFEINALYANEMETMLGDMGYRDIKTIKDIYGKNRNTICRK